MNEILLYTVMCLEEHGEGNVVYSEVCLRYRVRKILLRTMMCV